MERQDAQPVRRGAIDVHCHFVPKFFPGPPSSCSALGWPHMEHGPDGRAAIIIDDKEFRVVDSRSWDPERRKTDMDGAGVSVQVLSPMPELLSYWIDTDSAVELARHVNDGISQIVASDRRRFAGLGMVPLQDPDRAAAELSRVKYDHGLLGVEIGSNINGKLPGDPIFDRFFAEAERLELAIFVHALHPTSAEQIIGHPRLEALIAFPTDVGISAASCITGRLLEKFPNFHVAFSHGGGTLPAFLPRLQNGWQNLAFLQTGFKPPVEMARRFFYDNIVFDQRLLRFLIESMGMRQILAGSDYPFAGGQRLPGEPFLNLDLPAQDVETLSSGNAVRFLRLDPTNE